MIAQMTMSTVGQAEQLVKTVFPSRGPVERMFYWMWRRRNAVLVRRAMRLAGVASIDDTWVDIDEGGQVRGTIGLYARTEDEAEARWVSWFCVNPQARGQGVGKNLLDHVISVVRERGYRFLRLYTGSDSNQARAQILYESRGLREVRRTRLPFSDYDRIIRELGPLH